MRYVSYCFFFGRDEAAGSSPRQLGSSLKKSFQVVQKKAFFHGFQRRKRRHFQKESILHIAGGLEEHDFGYGV